MDGHSKKKQEMYIGGKQGKIGKLIATRIPAHNWWYVPFGGMLGVTRQKTVPHNKAVLNDKNLHMWNIWVQSCLETEELKKACKDCIICEEFHKFLKNSSPSELNRVQQAFRYLYLLAFSFNNVPNGSFSGTNARTTSSLVNVVDSLASKLKGSMLTRVDYTKFFTTYMDKKDKGLWYVDPPYYGCESYYDAPFVESDHKKLHGYLANMKKDKFMLSYGDHPIIRKLYSDFHLIEIPINYTASNKNKTAVELLYTNFETWEQQSLF